MGKITVGIILNNIRRARLGAHWRKSVTGDGRVPITQTTNPERNRSPYPPPVQKLVWVQTRHSAPRFISKSPPDLSELDEEPPADGPKLSAPQAQEGCEASGGVVISEDGA